MNETKSTIEGIAHDAGWDSYTLLLLMCRRLDEVGQSSDMISHLSNLRDDEGDGLTLDEKIEAAKGEGYTVNEKAAGEFVFNDPNGNDADNGPWPTESKAWAAAYDDMEA
ncbi:hypothetical protein [Microvirga tunisiensis]|uniref:Uncharacterized protein n=1 Tax=Microvirga tunisiensis TaxID=2108360 RepID=A0A5N7MWB9_9HYPH|nr:hypothetical protein [Microvirga tunisiensis]MPR10139.1 hypothetical protein [Microvirga tunisiensis]MPR28346.1 hypothetical protein [Microvirga tunisiensis]